MRGGQHAKIGAAGPRVAHRRHFVLLDGPQQFHLHGERHVADFVQEHGAAVGQLEQTLPRLLGPRERAADVAEQLALDHALAERGQTRRQKRSVLAAAVPMNGLGDQLLAGAAFARDQHGNIGRSDERDLLEDRLHRGGRADEDFGHAGGFFRRRLGSDGHRNAAAPAAARRKSARGRRVSSDSRRPLLPARGRPCRDCRTP